MIPYRNELLKFAGGIIFLRTELFCIKSEKIQNHAWKLKIERNKYGGRGKKHFFPACTQDHHNGGGCPPHEY
jgi:hypothetical protein